MRQELQRAELLQWEHLPRAAGHSSGHGWMWNETWGRFYPAMLTSLLASFHITLSVFISVKDIFYKAATSWQSCCFNFTALVRGAMWGELKEM